MESRFNHCVVATGADADPTLISESLIYKLCYGIVLPIFTSFGVLGNAITIVLITGKRGIRSLGHQNSHANRSLIALALSDCLFCLLAFPLTFVHTSWQPQFGFFHLYLLCNRWLLSTLILSSTWFTVLMAAERFVMVCYPLRARNMSWTRHTNGILATIFLLCVALNLPLLWKDRVTQRCRLPRGHPNATRLLVAINEVILINPPVEQVLRLSWAIVGNVVPLCALLYCNQRLIRGIRDSYRNRMNVLTTQSRHRRVNMRRCATATTRRDLSEGGTITACTSLVRNKEQPCCSSSMAVHSASSRMRPAASQVQGGRNAAGSSNFRVNLTLCLIVVTFLVLVAPYELIKNILILSIPQETLRNNSHYLKAELITNCMQILNFSCNFLLYCCFLRGFRRALKRLISQLLWHNSRGSSQNAAEERHSPVRPLAFRAASRQSGTLKNNAYSMSQLQ